MRHWRKRLAALLLAALAAGLFPVAGGTGTACAEGAAEDADNAGRTDPEETGFRAWYVTPKLFGAAGDGVTDDSAAMQAAMDYASEREIPLFVGDGTYLFGDVRLYNGRMYELFGAYYTETIEWNGRPDACLIVKNGCDAGFVGVRSADLPQVGTLPSVKLNMHDLKIKGEEGSEFPVCIRDVHFRESRFCNLQAAWFDCFIDGLLTGNTLVSNCLIQGITGCVFRSWSDWHVERNSYPAFADARIINNHFAGHPRRGTTLYYPTVFDAGNFYNNIFSQNFVSNMWAVIGAPGDYVLAVTASDNIYSFCPYFAWPKGDKPAATLALRDSVITGDAIWHASAERILNSEEGKMYFDDAEGNHRITGERIPFYNFDELTCVNIRDIVLRLSDGVLKDTVKMNCTKITRAYAWVAYHNSDAAEETAVAEHAFDTRFPLGDYIEHTDGYRHTEIDAWNGREVTELPAIQDDNYRYVLEGQTCYLNHRLLTCWGDRWYDAMGNPVN